MARLGDVIKPAKVVRCGKNQYPVLSMTMHDGIMLQSERFKKSLASIDQSNYKVVNYGQLVVGFPIDEGVLYIQRVVPKGIMSPAYNVWDINYDIIDPLYLELSLIVRKLCSIIKKILEVLLHEEEVSLQICCLNYPFHFHLWKNSGKLRQCWTRSVTSLPNAASSWKSWICW